MLRRLIESPTFTTLLNLGIKGTALLILNPVLFKFFRDEQVVDWYFLVSVVSIILILDFGLLPNSTRILARVYGESIADNNIFQRTREDILKLYFIFSTLILFGSLLFSHFYVAPSIKANISYWSILFAGASASLGVFNNYYASIIQAKQAVFLYQRLSAIVNLIVLLISILSVIILKNLSILVICYFSYNILMFISLQFILKKVNIERINVFILINNSTLSLNKEVMSSSIKSGVGMFLSLGFFNIINIYVAENYESNYASKFLLYMQIIRGVGSIAQAPFYSHIPEYNLIYGQKNIIELNKLINKRFIYSILLFIFSCVSIGIFLPYVFKFLDSPQSFSLDELWFLMCLAFLYERISSTLIQIISISKIIIWHWYNLIISLGVVTSMYLFFEPNDITSFPISLIVLYIFMGIPLGLFLAKRKLNFVPEKRLIKILLLAIIAPLIILTCRSF